MLAKRWWAGFLSGIMLFTFPITGFSDYDQAAADSQTASALKAASETPAEAAQSAEEQTFKSGTMKEIEVQAGVISEKAPFLPNVQGTRINAGKKTSVVRLKDMPTNANNNYRQALVKVPGLLLSEETTPLLSLGLRGLDPHRAQFMQVLKDGIPIHADMVGYPEAYYTPPLQVVEDIELIRGGAGLMYGPQPGGALNYVTKKPPVEKKILVDSENLFGTDNLFSTYESLSGTVGPLGYLAYVHEREGDGFRRNNSDFEVIGTGVKTIINPTGDTRLTLNYDQYHEEHGEPGGLSLTTAANPTYEQDRKFTTRDFDRFRLERYYGSVTFEKIVSDIAQLDLKVYGGRYRRYSKRQRGGGFGTIPTGASKNSNSIEEQNFYNLGFEPRYRHNYELFDQTHTLSLGAQTFLSHSPREDERGVNPGADHGQLRRRTVRDLWYFSPFIENLFRFGPLSITPGVRLEHIWQEMREIVNLDRTTPLQKEHEFDFAPLFGLGIVYEIYKKIELYGNISQSHRPKIFTQVLPTGPGETVSEDLQEGSAVQYDFGLRGQPVPYWAWDISYFLLDFENQIGSVAGVIQNAGDSRHQGMEFYTELDFISFYDAWRKTEYTEKIGRLAPFFTLTVLDANFYEGRNKGRQPRYAPKYNARVGIQYRWRDRVKASLAGTFIGDHFGDDASTLSFKIPSYKVWDLTAEVKLFKNVKNIFDMSLFGGINNIFDEIYYARVRGDGIDPAYGRNIYGGVKVNLG